MQDSIRQVTCSKPRVKFMAQAELESKLSGFQIIALIWLSYSEGHERLLVSRFPFHLGEKNGTQFRKNRLPRKQWKNLKASLGSSKNVVKCIFRWCILWFSLCMHWWVCILPTWLCVNIDLSVACTKWFRIDRGGPHQQESISTCTWCCNYRNTERRWCW